MRGPGPNVATRNCCQFRRLTAAQTWQQQIGLRSGVWPRSQIGNENFLVVLRGAWPWSKCGNEGLLSAPALGTGPILATRNWSPPRCVAQAFNWKRKLVLSCVAWCVTTAQMWQRHIAVSSDARPPARTWQRHIGLRSVAWPGPQLETGTCS